MEIQPHWTGQPHQGTAAGLPVKFASPVRWGHLLCHRAALVIAIGSFVIKQTQPKQKGYCFFYE